MGGLTSVIRALPDVEFRVQKNYYKAVVLGKVLYGVELWGGDERGKELDTIPARFIKLGLGLPLCTANCGVRKLGKEMSMQGDIIKRILGYWLKLETGREGEVLQWAFKWQKENGDENSWGGVIKRKVDKLGLGDIWGKTTERRDKLLRETKRRVMVIELQEWEGQCREKRTLEEFNEITGRMEMKINKVYKRDYRGFMWWVMGVYKNKGMREKGVERMCMLCGEEMGFAHLIRNCTETEGILNKYIGIGIRRKLEGTEKIEIVSSIIAKGMEEGTSMIEVFNIVKGKWERKRAQIELEKVEKKEDGK